MLLTEIGKRAPSMKALATLMTGALPLAPLGPPRPPLRLLRGVASGELLLTAALREPSRPAPTPPATAVTDGTITGRKIGVPYAAESHLLLVPARLAPADSMIVSSFGQIAPETAHDHGVALVQARRGGGGADPHAQLERGAGVCARARPRAGRGDARRTGVRARPVPAGGGGGVRAGRRGGGRGAGADQGSRRQPGAVRPAAGRVPGGVPADRRRVHRVPHHAPGRPVGVLAAGRGPRRGRRPRGGEILVRRAGTQVRSAMSSPARRDRNGRDLPLAPVFLAGRRPGPVPRPCHVHRPDPGAARPARRAARLLRRPADPRRARRAADRTARRRLPRRGAPDGPGRLARGGLAGAVRRPRVRPGGAADLRGRGGPRRRAAARGHAADRRPDPAGARHALAAGLLPAADPGRRGALRDRLHRARGRHRPGLAAHPGRPRRGGVRRRRAEDLHHRRARGRLRLAGLPHRARRPEAQGHLHPHRGHHRPGFLLDPDHHPRRRPPRQRDLLRGRAGPGPDAGRPGERRLAADHHPAQPRAGDARPGRPDRRPARPGARLGRDALPARPAGRAPGAGPGLGRDAGQRAAQLAGRVRADAGCGGRVGHQGLLLRAAPGHRAGAGRGGGHGTRTAPRPPRS